MRDFKVTVSYGASVPTIDLGEPIIDVSTGASSDEFQRFEDLTRSLVAAPKNEPDAKRAES